MRLRRWLAALILLGASATAAEFSKSLSPQDFVGAGLDQLTPAQLARLDALVREQQKGEVKKAADAVRAEARATEPAAGQTAGAAPTDRSFLSRAKVLLTPGTEVEYETIETELVGEFKGYAPGTVFALANGQRWQVVSGSYVTGPMPSVRRVHVEPGALGSFFLSFEGLRTRPKVKLVASTR